jgi:hypothetical protein
MLAKPGGTGGGGIVVLMGKSVRRVFKAFCLPIRASPKRRLYGTARQQSHTIHVVGKKTQLRASCSG